MQLLELNLYNYSTPCSLSTQAPKVWQAELSFIYIGYSDIAISN